MIRGQYALVIPDKVTPAGVRKVTGQLSRARVKPLGKGNVMVVRWDDNARSALEKAAGVAAFHVDNVPPSVISKLPRSEARIAKLWNWSIDNHGRRTDEAAVKRLWTSLNLEIRGDKMYDTLTRKPLGKVQRGETREHKGNWSLWQSRGWTAVPGWFGFWEKLYCWSQTFQTGAYGGAYEAVDFISAQVTGANHYAYQSRYTSPVAYAENWTYIWVGMTAGGRAYSYARKGGTTLQITATIR